MSGRAAQILGRFPAHLEAARPGKLLGDAVEALALDLDTLAAALAAVRRAHRLGDADELSDLWRIAALHGLGTAEFEILREARLEDAVRVRIVEACAIHADGNGTVMALLRGAANALDLDLGEVVHSTDRYWHVARVHDRLHLARLVPAAGGATRTEALPAAEELLGIEENPLWRAETDSAPRQHGELFNELRRGFERALLQVRMTGERERSIGPMLVNRDEGHGVGYSGAVANGQTLVFNEEGRVLLDGADVTSLAFAWQGACFAGDDADPAADFVFDGDGLAASLKRARFATATAPGALDREANFPSDGASLPMPGVAVGVTRLAFFVREGHFASLDGTPARPRGVTPRTGAAGFDESVFAPAPLPRTASARVALSWLEHRAFAVRLLVPARFRAWRAEAEGALTLQALAEALERFRPLGVELRVEFIDDRWTLGGGTLTSGVGDDPIESLRAGTLLWPAPPEAVT